MTTVKICPYSTSHHVKAQEYQQHLQDCKDSKVKLVFCAKVKEFLLSLIFDNFFNLHYLRPLKPYLWVHSAIIACLNKIINSW